VLEIFREGIERTMALCGRTAISQIDRGVVRRK
jgi:isopentenyl diphosphate isomerase/L-lactate dehydrogenase-like FMN-dependent dehydrogenase